MAALGVAVVGVVVGSIYGLQAKSNNDHATEPANCPTSTTCDKTGFDLTNKARNEATVSTVSFVVGAAALAGGAVLWLTAPRANGIRVAPSATGSYAGALLTGSF
jgi:serine/threonine-protein kinase